MRRLVDALREILQEPLPGRAAQKTMSPEWGRSSLGPGEGYRPAAVLILLCPRERAAEFPLIVRSSGPGPHGGQVALPGGALEAGETAAEAALRETREELGVDTSRVEVLGALTPLGVSVSRFSVTPIVAFSPERPVFKPAPAEVAECFCLSTEELTDQESKDCSPIMHDGRLLSVPCYRLAGRIVWGATAMALAEFEAVLRRTMG